jgi:hypothetical protein
MILLNTSGSERIKALSDAFVLVFVLTFILELRQTYNHANYIPTKVEVKEEGVLFIFVQCSGISG